ncbi:Bug family tripartite tricarboxylate transporter substrate binding protein [Nitrincola alkalilacustris]|uniref:Bug family tripartite tricarboxylate transporter substrate binding protein n=1 Tax=Nitrincola alkalilacustris TaxID=1571224 RepID=UPI00124C4B72|nr:tripartite tricarboxylate transporter substrate binding protein [Nitrincola alkalilacustris]
MLSRHYTFLRRFFVYALVLFSPLLSAAPLHLLIPSGPGGGWDTTAREVARVLQGEGLVEEVVLTNLAGAGGGQALLSLIEGEQPESTLMVQSLPLLLRNLTGVFDVGFRDIQPIALMIGAHQVVVVREEDGHSTTAEWLAAVQSDPVAHAVVGGSAPGSLDHITAVLLLTQAGLTAGDVRYAPSDAGADALRRFRQGLGSALVTGYDQVANELASGELRVLGIASPEPVADIPVPTFREQGYDVVLVNWRGFFARAGHSDDVYAAYRELLGQLAMTNAWKEVLARYGWSDFVLMGDDLDSFLEAQEEMLRDVLRALEIIQ